MNDFEGKIFLTYVVNRSLVFFQFGHIDGRKIIAIPGTEVAFKQDESYEIPHIFFKVNYPGLCMSVEGRNMTATEEYCLEVYNKFNLV